MKLQEVADMMAIKRHYQVWSIFVSIRKQDQELYQQATLEWVNERLAEELHKTVTKSLCET